MSNADEEWQALQKYYSMNRGSGALELDLNRLMKKGMSKEEAIHYLHEKILIGSKAWARGV